MALNICSYALSFTKLSLMLHTERTVIKYINIAGIEKTTSYRCGRQTKQSNVPSATTDDYYKMRVFIPVIDHLITT